MKHPKNLMGKIPPRTYEFQARQILGLQKLQEWVDWAVEAIVAGYDSKSLRILAGLQPPYDDKEVARLSAKSFIELDVIPLKTEDCISYYTALLIRQTLEAKRTQKAALEILMDLCVVRGYEKSLMDFHNLYYAVSDLETSEVQWYWKDANRGNIVKIIDDYFRNWLKNYCQNASDCEETTVAKG